MPQVAHDNTTTFSETFNFGSGSIDDIMTFNHEVAVGDGRYLKIGFLSADGGATVTHMKYAGELLDPVFENVTEGDSFAVYEMVAPAEGVNEVEIQLDDNSRQHVVVVSSYLLVDQFVPHGPETTEASAADGIGSFSDTVTLDDGGLAVDVAAVGGNSTTIEIDEQAGQTNRGEVKESEGSGFGTTKLQIAASEEGGGPGDVTLGWDETTGNDDRHWHVILPLRPMSAARERVYEYHENVYASRAAGSPQVRDAQGRLVMPEQLRANNWVRVEGPQMIDTHAYDDAAENSALMFAEIVGVRGENIILTPSRDSTAERILGRLTRK